jgi:hypothetical protein
MTRRVSFLVVAVALAGSSPAARAQPADVEVDDQGPPAEDADTPYGPPPIPPQVEEAPVAGPGGSYCYAGPHPVDRRASAGPDWDDNPGVHSHFYAPIDSRLFTLHDGCYTFIGDPTDFGYAGQVYSYYGAHPMLDAYGGGWCFMIGPHAHAFQPWSSSFVVVGNWYYWQGVYDAYFWNYWPYYSYYYRSYYPRYYGGGRYYRGGVYERAPAIRRIPGNYAGGWRGGAPGYGTSGTSGAGWRGGVARPPGNNGWHGPQSPQPARGGWSAPPQQPRQSAPGGGWSRPATSQPVAPSGGWSQPSVVAPRPASGGWTQPSVVAPRPATPTTSGWSRPAAPAAHGGWHRR